VISQFRWTPGRLRARVRHVEARLAEPRFILPLGRRRPAPR